MRRRDFLKFSSSASAGTLLLNTVPFRSFATPKMLPLLDCQGLNDRAIVLVFLNGGNDGLNTIIPIDQYNAYMGLRPTVGLPTSGKGAIVNLDETLAIPDQVAIHSEMTAFKTMYEQGRAQVFQAVGYPNANGSHFKSTDLWLTGGDGTAAYNEIGTGWMGRFLNNTYPGLYGNPNTVFQDPLGIQLGSKTPSVGYISDLREYIAANLTQQDPGGLYNLVQSIGAQPHFNVPVSDFGDQLSHIMSVENSANVYAQRITNVFNAGSNSTTAYPNSSLARQLKTVARLINGGCKTKVYMVQTGGFDTHSGQVEDGIPYEGSHANLLANVFNSIKAFHDDLAVLGLEDRILTLSMSEFGRKMTENGSHGTDHGNLAPMFIFGPAVEPGIYGTNVDLTQITNSGNLINSTQLQYDYRSIFHTVLQDWLAASDTAVGSTQFGNFDKIPGLINSNFVVDPSCYFDTYVQQAFLGVKVFLEGFYDTATDLMTETLVQQNLVPLAHPYNLAPFNYEGIESAGSMPLNAVDWVLVELRDASNVTNVVARRAAILRNDGQIIEPNGREFINFIDVNPGDYYVAVYHRSHVPVVSSSTHDTRTTTNLYDFTTAASTALGPNQLKAVGSNFALFAGNFDGNGLNDFNDYEAWKLKSSTPGQYLSEDGDGNGVVDNLDYNLWQKNKNQSGLVIFQ